MWTHDDLRSIHVDSLFHEHHRPISLPFRSLLPILSHPFGLGTEYSVTPNVLRSLPRPWPSFLVSVLVAASTLPLSYHFVLMSLPVNAQAAQPTLCLSPCQPFILPSHLPHSLPTLPEGAGGRFYSAGTVPGGEEYRGDGKERNGSKGMRRRMCRAAGSRLLNRPVASMKRRKLRKKFSHPPSLYMRKKFYRLSLSISLSCVQHRYLTIVYGSTHAILATSLSSVYGLTSYSSVCCHLRFNPSFLSSPRCLVSSLRSRVSVFAPVTFPRLHPVASLVLHPSSTSLSLR